MARGLDASTITAIATDGFELATLIEFSFSTPIRITDWHTDLEYDGNTYSSNDVLSVDDAKETAELRVNEITINLSGVDQTFIATFFNRDYIGIKCYVRRQVMVAGVAQGAPITTFIGQISSFEVAEDDGSSEVAIGVASHWKDFERAEGRWTNPQSQKRFFPSDEGFKFAKDATREMYWGRR